jgi:hypothetical protein
MTETQLAEIEQRLADANMGITEVVDSLLLDTAALIAEVRRLQAEMPKMIELADKWCKHFEWMTMDSPDHQPAIGQMRRDIEAARTLLESATNNNILPV